MRPASAYRSSGLFDIAVFRIATSSGGASGRRSSTGGYSHACTRRNVSNVVGATNGFTPATIS